MTLTEAQQRCNCYKCKKYSCEHRHKYDRLPQEIYAGAKSLCHNLPQPLPKAKKEKAKKKTGKKVRNNESRRKRKNSI